MVEQGENSMWRQGDVLIQRIDRIPDGLEQRNRLVLASGDTSGHKHQIKDRRTAELFVSSTMTTGELFLVVIADEAVVVHSEHAEIKLPRGTYRVWKQREFSDVGERTVLD
jgi:hypothetical protein